MKPMSLALLRKHCLQHMSPYFRIRPWGLAHTRLQSQAITRHPLATIAIDYSTSARARNLSGFNYKLNLTEQGRIGDYQTLDPGP
jgi:hypothetical protein